MPKSSFFSPRRLALLAMLAWLAGRGIIGKHPNAIMFVAHAQLALRAAHATACNAAQLRLLDLEVAGEHRADGGNGNLDPSSDVGSATYDLYGLFCANVYRGYVHMVAIGVIDAGEHMTHNNAIKHIARALHAFNARTSKV